jgi:integrase
MARTRDLWQNPAWRGHGKRWLAVWAGPGSREQTKAFAKKSDADRHGTAMTADQLRGDTLTRGAMLARDYGELKFLPSAVHLRPNSASTYTSHLRTHWWPLLGDRQIRSLSRSDMKAAVAALAAGLAPSTVETVFAVMRAMMAAAVDDGVIPVNPCSRVPLPRVEPREAEPLPAAAVLALADALPGRYRVSVPLAAGAGLRFGEATGLTVPRVDFLRRRILVVEQAQNAAFLRQRLDRRAPQPEGDPVPARSRDDRRDDGHLRAPVPRLRGPGRSAADDALAGALAEQERNRSAQ